MNDAIDLRPRSRRAHCVGQGLEQPTCKLRSFFLLQRRGPVLLLGIHSDEDSRRRSRQKHSIAEIPTKARGQRVAHEKVEVTVHCVHVDELHEGWWNFTSVQFPENPRHQQHLRLSFEREEK